MRNALCQDVMMVMMLIVNSNFSAQVLICETLVFMWLVAEWNINMCWVAKILLFFLSFSLSFSSLFSGSRHMAVLRPLSGNCTRLVTEELEGAENQGGGMASWWGYRKLGTLLVGWSFRMLGIHVALLTIYSTLMSYLYYYLLRISFSIKFNEINSYSSHHFHK